jgi:hypothetical protein
MIMMIRQSNSMEILKNEQVTVEIGINVWLTTPKEATPVN